MFLKAFKEEHFEKGLVGKQTTESGYIKAWEERKKNLTFEF